MEAARTIPVTASERDNAMVWDRQRRGHYEVWYLTLNHRESRNGFWIRYMMDAPLEGHGEPEARVWFASFDGRAPQRSVAINRALPISALRSSSEPFEIDLGNAALGHGFARGALEGAGHTVLWDLAWKPEGESYRQLPAFAYSSRLADTTLLTPNLDVAIEGEIVIDGRKLDFDGEPGAQTHLWGKKHAHEWAWGHCNAFHGRPGAALEALSVRLKRGPVVLPPLTMVGLKLDGELHRFAELHELPFTRGEFSSGSFGFTASGAKVRLEGEFRCRAEEMVTAEYLDPDGDRVYCANSEIADLFVTVWRRAGVLWREQERLYSVQSAHFEVAERTPDPAVARRHTAL